MVSVWYEKGGKEIHLVRSKEVASSVGKPPAVVRSIFNEVLDGKRAGEYVLTTQGGIVGDFVYIR